MQFYVKKHLLGTELWLFHIGIQILFFGQILTDILSYFEVVVLGLLLKNSKRQICCTHIFVECILLSKRKVSLLVHHCRTCVHLVCYPPPVSACAHISQVPGDHRAQIHWHHLQVWLWPFPDCTGEEGIHGECEKGLVDTPVITSESFCTGLTLTSGLLAGATEEGCPENSAGASVRGGLILI